MYTHNNVTVNIVLYNRYYVSRCGVADVLCLGNDDVIDAGVQLRGKAWPGTMICFFPGTLVSSMLCENYNLCQLITINNRLSQFPSKHQ